MAGWKSFPYPDSACDCSGPRLSEPGRSSTAVDAMVRLDSELASADGED